MEKQTAIFGISQGEVYELLDSYTSDAGCHGLCYIESSRFPVWCLFEKVINVNLSLHGIAKDGDEYVVSDWCNTPKGLLYAGVEWFTNVQDALKYVGFSIEKA